MKHIMKLPVGIPILRWNTQIQQWQRFTTTVEARYPEVEVVDLEQARITPLNIHAQFLEVECSADDTVEISVPSKLYPTIIVVKRHMVRVPDLSNIDITQLLKDWDEIKKKWSEKDWKEKYLNEWEYKPLWKPILELTKIIDKDLAQAARDRVDAFTYGYTYNFIKEKNDRFISSITAAIA